MYACTLSNSHTPANGGHGSDHRRAGTHDAPEPDPLPGMLPGAPLLARVAAPRAAMGRGWLCAAPDTDGNSLATGAHHRHGTPVWSLPGTVGTRALALLAVAPCGALAGDRFCYVRETKGSEPMKKSVQRLFAPIETIEHNLVCLQTPRRSYRAILEVSGLN